MADVYSFTTNVDDKYLNRVVAEADPKTNFLVVKEAETAFSEHVNYFLIVRDDVLYALGENLPNERLAGMTLGDWILAKESGQVFNFIPGYSVAASRDLTRSEVPAFETTLHNELNRLQNIIDGRLLRVTVESF